MNEKDYEVKVTTEEEQAAMNHPQVFEEPTAVVGREVFLVNDTSDDPDGEEDSE